ncbi:sphingosine kinase [Anaeramoeba ignava]|uniref:Sphingosine kinase n=1 Tax=Anaeramoeba ignava TaxID=1746090 RepID=A0A9Q0LST3_ANAIG|nr:sphingosine kinase [Anaeramoeba ignava]
MTTKELKGIQIQKFRTDKVGFIVNPKSGNGRAKKIWPGIEKKIKKLFTNYLIKKTTKAGDARKFASDLIKEGYTTICAAGGDGTTHEVFNGIMDATHENPSLIKRTKKNRKKLPNISFAILPIGTGCDCIRSFGVGDNKASVDECLQAIIDGMCGYIDIGKCKCIDDDGNPAIRYFFNISSFGGSAMIAYNMNRTSKALGFISYIWASFLVGISFKMPTIFYRFVGPDSIDPKRRLDGEEQEFSYFDDEDQEEDSSNSNENSELEINNKNLEDSQEKKEEFSEFKREQVMFFNICNGSTFGAGMEVGPTANLVDGLLDVCVVRHLDVNGVIEILYKLRTGTHVSMDSVYSFRYDILLETDTSFSEDEDENENDIDDNNNNNNNQNSLSNKKYEFNEKQFELDLKSISKQNIMIESEGEMSGNISATFKVKPRFLKFIIPSKSFRKSDLKENQRKK